jgi:cytoskeleton protein RodZ
LEEEDFAKLPGGIFNKGFVRAYSRYLGIDEEQAVTDYMAVLGEPHDPALDGERLKKLEANWKPPKQNLNSEASVRMPWTGIVVLLAVIVVLAAAWHYRHNVGQRWHQWRARRHPEVTQQLEVARQTSSAAYRATPAASGPSVSQAVLATPAVESQNTSPAGAPSSTSPAPPSQTVAPSNVSPAVPNVTVVPAAAASPDTPNHAIVLQIRAREDSWLAIEADGKSMLRGVLNARGEKTFRARKKLKLTAGNAGGVDLFLNGKPQPPLGEARQTRTVTFTADSMESRSAALE